MQLADKRRKDDTMSVQKKGLIGSGATKKSASAKPQQTASLKASALTAHSMKKKRPALGLRTLKAKAPTTDSFSFGAS